MRAVQRCVGQSPGETKHKLPALLPQWNRFGMSLILSAVMRHGMREVSPVREDWLSLCTQGFYWGSLIWAHGVCVTDSIAPTPARAKPRVFKNRIVRVNLSGPAGRAWPKVSGMQKHSYQPEYSTAFEPIKASPEVRPPFEQPRPAEFTFSTYWLQESCVNETKISALNTSERPARRGCRILYLREGDLVGYDSVVISAQLCWKHKFCFKLYFLTLTLDWLNLSGLGGQRRNPGWLLEIQHRIQRSKAKPKINLGMKSD